MWHGIAFPKVRVGVVSVRILAGSVLSNGVAITNISRGKHLHEPPNQSLTELFRSKDETNE